MPPVIASVRQLAQHLQTLPAGSVVGIEGFMASGKSFLARQLAESCGFSALHTDDFVQGDDETRPYIERLDLPRLNERLGQLSPNNRAIVIEGICLREVATHASIRISLYVYVKRVAESGLWHDGLHLEDFASEADTNAEEPELSDMRYHTEVRPHDNADFEIHRAEQSSAA